ncbi:hypothetical protein LPJ57_001788 [Coemansia sp. RSA 486]|nr:hypothetical protein LPJ57_001788 [Coemansia sp. RSA 486]
MPEILHKLKTSKGSVNAAIYDSTGEYVITAGQDKLIRLNNAQTGNLVQTYSGQGWAIQGLAINQESNRIVSCGDGRSVILWDVETATMQRKYTSGHSQRVDCVAINKEASVVVSGSFDKTVAVWDIRSMQHMPLQIMDDAKDGISCVAMTDTEVIAGSIDGSVRTYDIRAGKQVTDTMGQPVVSLRTFSSDILQKSVMAVACMDSTVQLIDRSNVSVMGTFAGHLCKNYRIQCDTNGKMVASGSEDGYVYVWNCLEPSIDYNGCVKYMSRLSGHSGIVNAVALHPHSAFDSSKANAMLSAASDGSIIIWK